MNKRKKMDSEMRAKQFMPFDALKGFNDALREKERIVVQKKDLSEERELELDIIIHQIQVNDIITVIYFNKDEYVKIVGMVSKIDNQSRILKIVNTKIPFDSIYDINY